MVTLFLLAAFFCLYTYVLFPVLLHLRAGSVQSANVVEPSVWPNVSIVIAVHNEEARLAKKIDSLLKLDYPEKALQCVWVSDGSTDKSVELLQGYQSKHAIFSVHHYEQACGKPTALNYAVQQATGDVLVFMDARQTVSTNAIKALVARLNDDVVGAVSGELMLGDEHGGEAKNVGLYWRYEKWIRLNESKLFSTTGATGALYAIRKKDYQPLHADALLDDFDTPVSLLKQGFRTVFEPNAQVYDQAEAQASGEFKRKARTLAGNFQSFSRNAWLFNPFKNPVFLQFLSHKVFRLLVPYAMALALLASVVGSGWFLNTMLVCQLIFYTLGVCGFLGLLGQNNKIVNFIKVFLQLNAAAVVGAIRYFGGNANVRWKQS